VGALTLALLVGGVSGWSLHHGDGSGKSPDGSESPPASPGPFVAWIGGTVKEGGDDFVLVEVSAGSGGPRVVRIEHVEWRTVPGVHLVVPPPAGMPVCVRVSVGRRSARSADFAGGQVYEGAHCAPHATA
jgi:hypothetical protein